MARIGKLECLQRRGASISLPVASFDVDAQAYFDRRPSIVDPGQKTAINNFYLNLKSSGLFDLVIDAILFAAGDFTDVFQKLIGSPEATNSNFVSGDFLATGATAGLKGNGSTKIANTNLPNGDLSQPNFHVSANFTQWTFTTGADVAFGRSGGPTLSIFGFFPFASFGFGGDQNNAVTQPSDLGLLINTRVSSTDLKLIFGGTTLATNTTPDSSSPTFPSETGRLWAIYNGVADITISDRRLSFYSAGLGLTEAQASDYTGFVNLLMDDLHASPYQIVGPYFAALFYNPDQTLRLVQSLDGVTCTKLPCSRYPADVPVRDPSLLIEDDFWWIVHTTAAFVAGTSFALCKAVAKSGNFVEVANPSLSSISGVQSPWGPKWYRSPIDGPHVIICASATLNSGPFKMYEMHPTNAARTTWSDPVEITGTGLPTNIIDAFLFEKLSDPGAYYILCKDEDSKYLVLLRSAIGPFSGYTVFEDAAAHDSGQYREGCSVVNTSGLNWLEYADFYQDDTGMHVRASSDDMATWGAWEPVDASFSVARNGVFIKST